jgi:hypothetical protein
MLDRNFALLSLCPVFFVIARKGMLPLGDYNFIDDWLRRSALARVSLIQERILSWHLLIPERQPD